MHCGGKVLATDIDPAVRAHVEAAVRHAGLEPDDTSFALLLESAPHAIAMARRLPRDIAWTDEQAAVFRLDRSYFMKEQQMKVHFS